MKIAVWILMASGAWAQEFEFGALGGGAFLGSATLSGAAGSAAAGLAGGPAAGLVIGQDRYDRLSGELRYLYQRQGLRLASGSAVAGMRGEAHALHYDLLWHARGRKERVRPFVAVGGGLKLYRGSGAETAWRPLMEVGYLTRAHELKPMIVAGGGFKIRLAARVSLRVEVRNQSTRFPSKVISPAPGVRTPWWLHDLVPNLGLTWMW